MKHGILFACLLISSIARAQFDHLQTQYLFNAFLVNPAIAGEQGNMVSTLSYRSQWVGFSGAPETFAFTTDSPIRNRHHNIGVVALSDRIGVINQSVYRIAYAYRIVARNYFFSAGIAPQLLSTRAAWNQVVTNQQDAVYNNVQQETDFGIAFGLYFNAEHFFVGLSGQSTMRSSPSSGIRRQPYYAYCGVRLGNTERFSVVVSTLARYLTPSYLQFDANVNVKFRDRIGAGVSYRWKESLAGMLSLKLNDQFMVGYSYDFNISKLARYNSGSHEIMLRYEFRYNVHSNSPR